MQIKKNDTVQVMAGKEKGKRGRVIAVYPKTSRLLIEKLNLIKRHTKPNPQLKQGGIVERESPIAISNVRLICSKCDKPTTVSRRSPDGGKRVRTCTICESALE